MLTIPFPALNKAAISINSVSSGAYRFLRENFCRFGALGAAYIHDRRDDLALGYMSADALRKTLRVVLEFSKRVINAPVFPIERKISDEMKNKVDKYLFRKK